jgi:predicted phage tail protein
MLAFQRTGVPLYDALTLRNFPRIVADKAAGSMGPAGSPTSVTATAVGTNATIAWANPFNGSVPSGFRVEIAASENGGHLYGAINVGATYSFVTTLPQGRYLVRVRALNAGGAPGAASNDVRLIVGLPPISDPPLPPDGFRAVVDGQTVQLYWNLRQDSAPATGYLIDASSIPNFTTNFGTFDTNSSERSFVFRNVQPGTYFARVRARNQFGASGPSNEITINVGGSSCGQLVAPTGLNATVVGRLVTLNWNPPVLPGAILGYIVEAGTAPGLSDVVAANIPNQTAVSANNVAPGRYYVRVRARTANCGTTPASPDVTVVVP